MGGVRGWRPLQRWIGRSGGWQRGQGWIFIYRDTTSCSRETWRSAGEEWSLGQPGIHQGRSWRLLELVLIWYQVPRVARFLTVSRKFLRR